MQLATGNLAAATSANLAVVPVVMLLATSTAKAFSEHQKLCALLRGLSRLVLAAFTVQFLMQFSPEHFFALKG